MSDATFPVTGVSVVDLFCGAGGLSYDFRREGFPVRGAGLRSRNATQVNGFAVAPLHPGPDVLFAGFEARGRFRLHDADLGARHVDDAGIVQARRAERRMMAPDDLDSLVRIS